MKLKYLTIVTGLAIMGIANIRAWAQDCPITVQVAVSQPDIYHIGCHFTTTATATPPNSNYVYTWTVNAYADDLGNDTDSTSWNTNDTSLSTGPGGPDTATITCTVSDPSSGSTGTGTGSILLHRAVETQVEGTPYHEYGTGSAVGSSFTCLNPAGTCNFSLQSSGSGSSSSDFTVKGSVDLGVVEASASYSPSSSTYSPTYTTGMSQTIPYQTTWQWFVRPVYNHIDGTWQKWTCSGAGDSGTYIELDTISGAPGWNAYCTEVF